MAGSEYWYKARAGLQGSVLLLWVAIVWICRNQLGRRNITDERKTALIGEAYNAQKMSIGNHAERGEDGKYLRSEVDLRGKRGKTGEKIAKEFGVGYGTVLRAKDFVNGLNEAENVSPGIKEAVLSGSVKAQRKRFYYFEKFPRQKPLEMRGY